GRKPERAGRDRAARIDSRAHGLDRLALRRDHLVHRGLHLGLQRRRPFELFQDLLERLVETALPAPPPPHRLPPAPPLPPTSPHSPLRAGGASADASVAANASTHAAAPASQRAAAHTRAHAAAHAPATASARARPRLICCFARAAPAARRAMGRSVRCPR